MQCFYCLVEILESVEAKGFPDTRLVLAHSEAHFFCIPGRAALGGQQMATHGLQAKARGATRVSNLVFFVKDLRWR